MLHERFKPCVDACFACAEACDHCATSCLQEKDVHNLARCIELDIDCAEICRLAAAFMSRGSAYASALAALCTEVCVECAEECARHPMDHCQECAQACRRCAEACRLTGAAQAGARRPGASG